MKTINIFLASTNELKPERDNMERFIRRENDRLHDKGIYLNLSIWEDFLDAMSSTRLQDEYNKAVARSDIFLSLHGTKVGRYTEEEFDVAHNNFKKNQSPKFIYTYFKEMILTTSSVNLDDLQRLRSFQNKVSELGHFYTSFKNIDDLLFQFKQQLNKIIDLNLTTNKEKEKIDTKTSTSKKVKIIKLLLCSPGDVQNERKSVSNAVYKFNQSYVEESGLFIKLIRWEDMAPQIGPGPQNVINKQIENYHLFLGIMWNRFGTPTEVAASGSKEEYDMAIAMWKAKKRPWVTFYFCDKPSNFVNQEQLEQKSKVLNFRTELNALGVVRSYSEVSEFEEKIYNDIIKIVSTPEFKDLIK